MKNTFEPNNSQLLDSSFLGIQTCKSEKSQVKNLQNNIIKLNQENSSLKQEITFLKNKLDKCNSDIKKLTELI